MYREERAVLALHAVRVSYNAVVTNEFIRKLIDRSRKIAGSFSRVRQKENKERIRRRRRTRSGEGMAFSQRRSQCLP